MVCRFETVSHHPLQFVWSQDNLKRQNTKQLLKELEGRFPRCVGQIFASMSRVIPPRLLDRTLYDFASFQIAGSEHLMGQDTVDKYREGE